MSGEMVALRVKNETMHPAQVAVPILMYHSVDTQAHRRFRRWVVDPAAFTLQLAHLAAGGYTPISISQLRASMTGRAALPLKPVVLTFDDGFADFFTTVLPQLQKYRFASTLYLTTNYIDGTSRWLVHEGEAGRPLLNWDQVRIIAAAGVEIGAHTHTHPQLDVLPDAMVREEVKLARKMIEERAGVAVASFAYPFGYFSATTRHIVKAEGYSSAVAVKYAMSSTSDDPFALSRLIVSADTTLAGFAALLTTPTPWQARVAERARARVWHAARLLRHTRAGSRIDG